MFAAGVVGFKCFLVPSGVDEFPHVTEERFARSDAGAVADRRDVDRACRIAGTDEDRRMTTDYEAFFDRGRERRKMKRSS